MKGIVFTEFLDMVEAQFTPEVADHDYQRQSHQTVRTPPLARMTTTEIIGSWRSSARSPAYPSPSCCAPLVYTCLAASR